MEFSTSKSAVLHTITALQEHVTNAQDQIFIQNNKLEIYLHKQLWNLMFSLQGAPHPYILLYQQISVSYQPPPPTTHTHNFWFFLNYYLHTNHLNY